MQHSANRSLIMDSQMVSSLKLVDTHCHLVSPKLKDSLAELLVAARHYGVAKIINIAYDPETIELASQQMLSDPMIYAAFGIQPHDSNTYTYDVAERIRAKVRDNKKVVAIGEIGLDNYHKDCSLEQQIPCFEHFLQIACDEKLPVVVHVRETHREVADRISEFGKHGLTGVIHCFTGTVDEAREFLDLGMYISFSGIVTFKNSESLRDVARFVPADRFLIETDSPYLAPVPERGKTNQPAWVKHVCESIATVRGMTVEEVASLTTSNAHALFTRLGNT